MISNVHIKVNPDACNKPNRAIPQTTSFCNRPPSHQSRRLTSQRNHCCRKPEPKCEKPPEDCVVIKVPCKSNDKPNNDFSCSNPEPKCCCSYPKPKSPERKTSCVVISIPRNKPEEQEKSSRPATPCCCRRPPPCFKKPESKYEKPENSCVVISVNCNKPEEPKKSCSRTPSPYPKPQFSCCARPHPPCCCKKPEPKSDKPENSCVVISVPCNKSEEKKKPECCCPKPKQCCCKDESTKHEKLEPCVTISYICKEPEKKQQPPCCNYLKKKVETDKNSCNISREIRIYTGCPEEQKGSPKLCQRSRPPTPVCGSRQQTSSYSKRTRPSTAGCCCSQRPKDVEVLYSKENQEKSCTPAGCRYYAKKPSEIVFPKKPYVTHRGPIRCPGLKRVKSVELRCGILYRDCRCEKRDGLQDVCERYYCSRQPECFAYKGNEGNSNNFCSCERA